MVLQLGRLRGISQRFYHCLRGLMLRVSRTINHLVFRPACLPACLPVCQSIQELVYSSVCLFVCPSVHPPIRLSIQLPIRPSVYTSVRQSVRLSIRPSVHLFHTSVSPFTHLSVCPPVCLSICFMQDLSTSSTVSHVPCAELCSAFSSTNIYNKLAYQVSIS